jgi:hypothetical protein
MIQPELDLHICHFMKCKFLVTYVNFVLICGVYNCNLTKAAPPALVTGNQKIH